MDTALGYDLDMVTALRTGPKPKINERDYIPSSPEDAAALFQALVDVGVKDGVARSIVGTLLTLPDVYGPSLRVVVSRYRLELAKVGEPPWERLGSDQPTRDKGAYLSSATKRTRRRGGRRVGGSHWSGRLELAA